MFWDAEMTNVVSSLSVECSRISYCLVNIIILDKLLNGEIFWSPETGDLLQLVSVVVRRRVLTNEHFKLLRKNYVVNSF